MYKVLNEGLVAAITTFVEEMPEDDKETPVNADVELTEEVNEDDDSSYELPPDITLVGCLNGDPKTLDKALCGPNFKEWQEALKYFNKSAGKVQNMGCNRLTPRPYADTMQ